MGSNISVKLFGLKNLPLTYVFIAVIALAIPLTLVLISQEQDIRQEASMRRNKQAPSTITPPIVTCNDNVTKVTLEDDCSPNNENSFRKMSFMCANGLTQDMGSSQDKSSCLPAGAWLARANQFCRTNTPSCRSLTPTPTPTPTCTRVSGDGYYLGERCESGGWKSISQYKCTDQFVGGAVQADGGRCLSSNDWNIKVAALCKQRGSCYEAPTVTPTLTPTPTACVPVRLDSGSGPENSIGCRTGWYKSYRVKCTDGYDNTFDDARGCMSVPDWQIRARNICLQRSSC